MSDHDDNSPPGDTGRRRRISESDAEEIIRAQRRIQESDLRTKTVRDMQLRDAEMFGVDGKGGRFAAMEDDVKDHGERLVVLETFKIKAMVLGSIALVFGGIVASLISKFIDRLF